MRKKENEDSPETLKPEKNLLPPSRLGNEAPGSSTSPTNKETTGLARDGRNHTPCPTSPGLGTAPHQHPETLEELRAMTLCDLTTRHLKPAENLTPGTLSAFLHQLVSSFSLPIQVSTLPFTRFPRGESKSPLCSRKEGKKDANQDGNPTASASLLALCRTAKNGTQLLTLEQQALYQPSHLPSSLNLNS